MDSPKPDEIRVLCVDDDPQHLELVATCLERESEHITVVTTTDARSGRERLADGDFDCIVSDYDMPGTDGLAFLRSVREDGRDLPFILFTGKGSEEVASDAITAGVSDYLQKTRGTDQYAVLANRIENLVRLHRLESGSQNSSPPVHTDREPDEETTATERSGEMPIAGDGDEPPGAFDALAEAAADGIMLLDTDSVVRYANPAVERILGFTPQELVGNSKMKIIPERLREAHADGLQRYLRSGEKHIDWTYVELPGRHRDGHEVPLAISFNEFRFDGDRYFVGMFRDISARKEAERDLQRKNDRLEEFASVVSHDLRSPLNVVRGRIELAREEGQDEHLERALDALDRGEELIDDLLTLAHEGATVDDGEPLGLAATADECWQTVETAGATLRTDTDRRLVADRSRLRQLLENLFRNAVEHAGPDVRVTVRDLPDGFSVSDDGPGIPAEDRGRVFEAGFTTDGDSGLGLSIVREIADAHGWDVAVTESETGGTRFEITGVDRPDR